METANVPANELACPVCLEIPSRVLECSQCRQVLCAACETHLPRCPLCRAEPLQARPCPPVQRLLDRLRARCPFCDREVARTELDAHMHVYSTFLCNFGKTCIIWRFCTFEVQTSSANVQIIINILLRCTSLKHFCPNLI